jgi:hypothetical protein
LAPDDAEQQRQALAQIAPFALKKHLGNAR